MARAKPELPYRIEVNDQCVPDERKVRTVPQEGVCDAYYPYGNQPHGHHLQDAQDDVDMSVWGWGEQGRYLQQEDKNKDDNLKR
jgi:hypothetical protein